MKKLSKAMKNAYVLRKKLKEKEVSIQRMYLTILAYHINKVETIKTHLNISINVYKLNKK